MENLCAKVKLQLSDFVHACRLAIFPEDRPSPVFSLLDVVLNGGLLVWSCAVICSSACEVTSRRWMVLGIVNAIVNIMFGILIMAVVRFRIYRGIALNVSEWSLFITEPVMLGYLAYLVWEIAWMVVAMYSPLYALQDDCGSHLTVQVGFFVTYLVLGAVALVLSFATQVGHLPPWRQRAYTCWARRQQVLGESAMRNEVMTTSGQDYRTRHDLLSMTTTLNTTFSDESTHRDDVIGSLSQFTSSTQEPPPPRLHGPSPRPGIRPGPHDGLGRECGDGANNNNNAVVTRHNAAASMAESSSNMAGSFAAASPPIIIASATHRRDESPQQQRRHATVSAGMRVGHESKPSCLVSLAGSVCSDSLHSTPLRSTTPAVAAASAMAKKAAVVTSHAATPATQGWNSVTTSPALEHAVAHVDPVTDRPSVVHSGGGDRGSSAGNHRPSAAASREAVDDADDGPHICVTAYTPREMKGRSGASSVGEDYSPREGPR